MFAASGGLSPVDRFNNAKAPMHGITKNAVTGVGDEAYFITTPGVGTALNVKKGGFVFQIRVSRVFAAGTHGDRKSAGTGRARQAVIGSAFYFSRTRVP